MFRKLYRVLTSELIWRSRLRYLGTVLVHRWGVTKRAARRVTFYWLKHGGRVGLRLGSTDFQVFEEIFVGGAYARFTRLLPKDGTIVDLGANVGLSAIFLARAAPGSRVIAVEPDGGNFEMLLENVRGAGLEYRVTAVRAFAGAERGFAAIEDSGNGEWGLRMGALHQESGRGIPVRTIVRTIAELIDGHTPQHTYPVSLKCDVEGSERELFSGLREWEDLVGLILLELHTELFPASELYGILRASSYEWAVHGEIPADGCIALIALERKARKPNEISGALAALS
jgi:FkbM family methyltransferase